MKFKGTIRKGVICPCPGLVGRVSVELSRFKADEIVDVNVEKPTRKRTLRQNSRYWSVIVPAFAEWTGYEAYPEHLEKQDLKALQQSAHRTLKAMFIGSTTVTRTLPNGTTVTEVHEPSTAGLTTAQMATLQTQAERLLNENDIYLPANE